MEEIVEIKCPKCKKMVDRSKVVKAKYVCYECGGYLLDITCYFNDNDLCVCSFS